MKRPTIREKIPEHLHPFIAEQNPALYTPMDHASWRYILRVSKAFFASHAHKKYLDGLVETGISTERIPLISEVDAKLSEFGWRAVAVVGFIPPAAFMEFLSLGILPIACDMRAPEHLSYTPAPDIVHEAAGHAPIIADPDYADYLTSYGEIARKVIFSDQDMAVYEAIRHLSDTKEDPNATDQTIADAQKQLDQATAAVDWVSEATQLSRMGWWTFEYGLVGDLKNPKIYGAGLLSSIAESSHCLSDDVKKIRFSLDCINMSYDITKPQPQLFVAPDFETLGRVLEQLAGLMAFRIGGLEALMRGKRSGTVTTTDFDSGLQISGKLTEVLTDQKGQPCYLRYEGPTQLAQADVELEGQGADYHRQGYSTPIGRLIDLNKPASALSDDEIARLKGQFEFTSGIVVRGKVKSVLRRLDRVLIIAFENCTVTRGDTVLFKPEWGTFDMGCGAQVTSVFGGAADRTAYMKAVGGFEQKPANPKTNMKPGDKDLMPLYQKIRDMRERGQFEDVVVAQVNEELERKFPNDWLLRLELLEVTGPWQSTVRERLKQIAESDKDKSELIARGLALL